MIQEFSRLRKYVSQHTRQMLAGCAFVVATNLFGLLTPWVLKQAIDALKSGIAPRALLGYAGLLVAVALFGGFFRFMMRKTMIGVSRHIEYELRNDFFAHLQKLSQTFYNQYKTGDLMARATNDLEAVRQVVGPAIMYSLNTIMSLIFFIAMFHIDARLALLSMAPFPIMAATVHQLARRLNKAHKEIQTQYATITSRVQENLSGIRVVKAYAQEEGEIASFRELNAEFIDLNLGMVKIRGLMFAAMGLLVGVGDLIILWFGGLRVMDGSLSLGEFVAFFSYLGMLTWPMIALGWVINLFQQGAASMGRLNRIFESEPDIRDSEAPAEIQRIEGDIEFRGVSFAYDGVPVLQDIHLKIAKGTTLAIVGPTGSGKSTLVNLIPRLIQATEGQVLIDGHPVEQIPLSVLRQSIGYVPQDTFLFSDTIEANIAFGVESASDGEVRAAAEVSHVYDDIMAFPRQFGTLLGERGINLSGGQKQRTAIARAVLRNPSILLLDDSLSAVDTYTEEAILQQLRAIMRDRTSIIVSHRISTVKDADVIGFLDNGRICELGTHDELVRLGGSYAALHEKQLLEEALESF